jgi:hypothetical protein
MFSVAVEVAVAVESCVTGLPVKSCFVSNEKRIHQIKFMNKGKKR